MYVSYTDSNGNHHKFVLDNCYTCSVVRTPLVSASHLVSKGCEIHLTNTGNHKSFPDDTKSTLETLTSGLIPLLPQPLADMRAQPTSIDEMTKGINQISIQEENDPEDAPSQLATSRITTINPSDSYEIEVGEDMPTLITDESEDDSDSEYFVPKEGNTNQD